MSFGLILPFVVVVTICCWLVLVPQCCWLWLQGSNFGRILIWVNDGQLWVSTELKVRASPPFVKIENKTGIIVQRYEDERRAMETAENDLFYSVR